MQTSDAIAVAGEAFEACRDLLRDRICDVFLYGSYARGDYDEESDIDILLTVDAKAEELCKYRDAIALIASNLSLKHDKTVSLTMKPLDQFRRYSSVLPFYQNVLREGIRYAV